MWMERMTFHFNTKILIGALNFVSYHKKLIDACWFWGVTYVFMIWIFQEYRIVKWYGIFMTGHGTSILMQLSLDRSDLWLVMDSSLEFQRAWVRYAWSPQYLQWIRLGSFLVESLKYHRSWLNEPKYVFKVKKIQNYSREAFLKWKWSKAIKPYLRLAVEDSFLPSQHASSLFCRSLIIQ